MIRLETATHWILVTHPDHARIAGEFADAWGNERFPRPEPFGAMRHAVYHHDDGWRARDAAPVLTRDNRPEAFTRQLVGTYSAFEEIDLPSYLRVRGQATAEVAAQNKAAGILVSMHTTNLLTEQADLATIRPEHRGAHAEFLAGQLAWQHTAAQETGMDPATLRRGFEFLQCCDNLSLIVCSGYDGARDLRHRHPDREGRHHAIRCAPAGASGYTLTPWPCADGEIVLQVPFRAVPKSACTSVDAYRQAFHAAPIETRRVVLRSG
ncbi:MAG: DUF3891 family protein [Opitutaceae bacterium]|nr:DUF3891 family protein [Opitutaceae bacterium]